MIPNHSESQLRKVIVYMSIRKTHKQFLEELKRVNPNIVVEGRYESAITKIDVKCSICGYTWDVRPSSLLSGQGCPECGKIKKGNALRKSNEQFISDLYKVNKFIEPLEKYTGNKNKIRLRCRNCGNEWKMTPKDLLRGHGCPVCGYYRQRDAKRCTPEEFAYKLQKVNPNIEPVEEYYNNHKKIKFKCNICDHIWLAAPYSVLAGHGCPQCARSSTSFIEQVLFHAFETTLGKGKVLSRDRELIRMELDIVVPTLKIAFEPGSWDWHKKKINKDELKREKCKKLGYTLYTVYTDYKLGEAPFEEHCYISPENLVYSNWNSTKAFIRKILGDQNLFLTDTQWDEVKAISVDKSRKRTPEQFAEEMKGINPTIRVIGKYADIASKIEVECSVCGHLWSATAGSLLAGHGCPKCGNKKVSDMRRKTQEQFVSEIKELNPAIIILGEYVNTKTKILCECRTCSNKWDMRPQNLLKGQGCPKCGRKKAANKKRKTHEQFVEELKEKNPRVVAVGKYVDSRTKIEMKCKKCEYIWSAHPMDVLRGHGCPKCGAKR